MDVYSVTLALALAAAILATLLALGRRFRGLPGARAVVATATVALLLDLVSVAHHWTVGHAPGSGAALAPGDFLAQHTAFGVVAGLAAAALLLSRFSRRRRSPQ